MRIRLLLFIFLLPGVCQAGGLPLDPTQFLSPQLLVLDSVSKALIKMVGIAADQRPYQSATPLGTKIGLDLGIEATLIKVPDDFNAALTTAGLTGTAIPVFPIPRIQVHKGIGDRVDIGASYVGYHGYKLLGADFKVNVYMPEEGPTWAVRLCYSSATIQIVDTKTYTPQVLISKQLDFSDPYMGFGYEMVHGTVTVPTPIETFSSTGSANAFMAFLGVAFRAQVIGLRLVLEGSYNSGGAHTLGTNFGFSF